MLFKNVEILLLTFYLTGVSTISPHSTSNYILSQLVCLCGTPRHPIIASCGALPVHIAIPRKGEHTRSPRDWPRHCLAVWDIITLHYYYRQAQSYPLASVGFQ